MRASPFSVDLRALALWRIGLGSVTLLDIVLRWRDWHAFYGDEGLFSRSHHFQQALRYDGYHLFLASGNAWGLGALFAVWAAAAVCLTIGYRTRLAGLVTWYFVAAIGLRNSWLLDGGDDLLRVLLFWTPFLPLSARWSVEALKNRHWSQLPHTYRSVATFGVTLQLFVLYLFAALLKTGSDWRQSGDALYYILAIDANATRLGSYLTGYPDLLRPLSWGVLGVEFLLALLLLAGLRWNRARDGFFLLAVAHQIAIASVLHFGIFVAIVIAAVSIYAPSSWLDRIATWVGAKWPTVAGSDKTDSPGATTPPSPQADPPAYRLEAPLQLFAAFICAMIAVFNLYSIDHGHRIPPGTRQVMTLTFQQQHWHLFAPSPMRDDGWFALEVTNQDGTVEDAWGNGLAIGDKPTSVASRFANHRWRRWLQNLVHVERADVQQWRQSTLEYAVKQWKQQHPDAKAQRFRLLYLLERTPPPGEFPQSETVVLAETN